MNLPPSPENNEIEKAKTTLRRMGMSLSTLGAVLLAAALVACCQNADNTLEVPSLLLLASGVTTLIAGLYLWFISKQTD